MFPLCRTGERDKGVILFRKDVIRAVCGCRADARYICGQIHYFFINIAGAGLGSRLCAIVGGQILDGKIKDFLVAKASLEILINTTQIDLLFNLQLVVVGEVERHRHVGLPHTALHVVHGEGVGLAFFKSDCFAFVVEINWNCVSIFRRLIIHLKFRAISNVFP